MADSIDTNKSNKINNNISNLELITKIAQQAREASFKMSSIDTKLKNEALLNIANRLVNSEKKIITKNNIDIENAEKKNLATPLVDRLVLNTKRIESMSEGLRQIAELNDPIGEIVEMGERPNGLKVSRMKIPLGVIGIIYESRPNVTADAAGLCLKAGNSVILRGGSEAFHSNTVIGELIKDSLEEVGLPKNAVQVVPVTDRDAILEMLKLEELIDLIIPRGGEGLIRFVVENSRIPVLKHYKGVCHVFVDEFADIETAIDISVNSKVQRPGVCNAMETLLVHENISEHFLPIIAKELKESGVEIKGCERTKKIIPEIKLATENDWYEEYLDLILNIRVVDSIDDAISHIDKYGSMHTESIVTKNKDNSNKFLRDVNSSAVMVNASTRFNDGFELGLGAEIGISTSKLHSFGPMGVEELTSKKFIVEGKGQIKQ